MRISIYYSRRRLRFFSRFLFSNSKDRGQRENRERGVSPFITHARLSINAVLTNYFSRSSSFPSFLSGRGETFSIVVLESIDSICTELPCETRRDTDASQYRLSGLLHGYRYCRSATLCSQHDPRAQVQFHQCYPHRSLVRSVFVRIELLPLDSQLFSQQPLSAVRRCSTYLCAQADAEGSSLLFSPNRAQCQLMLHAEYHRFNEPLDQYHINEWQCD